VLSPRGSNAAGHRGWYTVKCRICARKLYIGSDVVYYCPKCHIKYSTYFCEAHSRKLHRRCPYCGTELKLYL